MSAFQLPTLLSAVEEQNVLWLQSILYSHKFSQEEVDTAFKLCVAHRENLECLKLILEMAPSIVLIDRTFLDCAWSGIFPKMTKALLPYVSSGLSKEIYKILKAARAEGDSSFYFPSFIEEDRHDEIFRKLIPNRLRQRKKSLIQNQIFMNELFDLEVFCDHRLIVADLLTLPPSYPRPSTSTIANAFLSAVFRKNFSMAKMIIEYDEGSPIDHLDSLLLGQFGIDFAFRELLEMQCLHGVSFVLSRVQLRPDQSLIDTAFRQFSSNAFTQALVRERLRELRFRSRSNLVKWGCYWRNYFNQILSVLALNVSPQLIEIERLRRERMERQQRALNPFLPMTIHSFSSTAVIADTTNEAQHTEGDPDEITANQPPSNSTVRRKKFLIDAVNDFIAHKLGLPTLPSNSNMDLSSSSESSSLPSIEEVENSIIMRIRNLFSSETQRNEAVAKLTEGIDSTGKLALIRVWYYLNQNFPDRIDTWLTGFLGESVIMHSCNPGVVERIVTGLRGIGDEELDAIFCEAEGPYLSRLFLNNAFNFYLAGRDSIRIMCSPEVELHVNRAKRLAQFLVGVGNITLNSTSEEIKGSIRKFAEHGIEGNFSQISALETMIDAVVDVAMDLYDDCVQPFVEEILAVQQIPQSLDGESAASAI